jgi:hypothetical protein
MNINLNRPAMSSRRRRRRGHDLLIVLLLALLAVAAALIWLAQHLAILAGVALLVWGAYSLGRRAQGRARPGQAVPPRGRPEVPAAAPAVPAVTLPPADYDWDQRGARHKARLLADPRPGVRPLSKLRGS